MKFVLNEEHKLSFLEGYRYDNSKTEVNTIQNIKLNLNELFDI